MTGERGRTRRLRPAALVAAGSVLMAGCSIGDTGPEPRPAAPGARTGGSITVAVPRTSSLDPADAVDPTTGLVVATMCDSLLGVDPQTGELVGALASSWTVLDGGASVTLTLRRDATFSDGTRVRPKDVVATMTRLALPDTAGAAAELLREVVGFPEIRGEIDTEIGDPRRTELVGVTALTDRTVSFAFAEPSAEWVATLAHPATAILPEALLLEDAGAPRTRPVCAGPYAMEDRDRGDDTATLVRSQHYHAQHAGLTNGGAGYLDEIVFRFVDDPFPSRVADAPDADEPAADAADDAADGQGDGDEPQEPEVAPPAIAIADADLQRVPADAWDEAETRTAHDLVRFVAPELDVIGISRGAEEGAELARALSRAVDRRAIVAAMGDGRVVADGFVPDVLADRDELGSCPAIPGRPEPAAARDLRDTVDGAAGPLTFTWNDDFRNRVLVEEVVRQLEAMDLDVESTVVGWPDLQRRVATPGALTGLYRQSLRVQVPSSVSWLSAFMDTGRIGRTNWSGFSFGAVDELLDDVGEAAVDGDRELLRRDLANLACDLLPVIPIAWAEHGWLVDDDLTSAVEVFADPTTGFPLLRELHS